MNYAGGMYKERVEEFRQLESALLPPIADVRTPAESDSSWTSSWLRSIPGLTRSVSSMSLGAQLATQTYLPGLGIPAVTSELELSSVVGMSEEGQKRREMTRYIQGLKDYIIGSIHWGYETEMFFGTKGDETRSFGWVFSTDSSA